MEARTKKEAYDARDEDGQVCGAIRARDWDRFRQTLRFVPPGTQSLLDCGCDRGHWLAYVLRRRRVARHLGIDVSAERVQEARDRYPELALQVGYLEELSIESGSFEVVTCLEVLEHIPHWQEVLDSLLRVAGRRVLASVPYRETIRKTACIHCGKVTPLYGHLHSFSEDSFPLRSGWRRAFGYVKDYGIGSGWKRHLYMRLRPRSAWLVVTYDREPA